MARYSPLILGSQIGRTTPMSATATSPDSRQIPGYTPLVRSVLRSLDREKLDVFFWNERAGKVVLFRESGVSISDDRFARMAGDNDNYFYLRQSDFESACGDILDSLETLMADETVSPADRYEVLQTALTYEVEKSLKSIDPSEYLALVGRVGSQIKQLVGGNRILPADLFAIAKHDSHTFAHLRTRDECRRLRYGARRTSWH